MTDICTHKLQSVNKITQVTSLKRIHQKHLKFESQMSQQMMIIFNARMPTLCLQSLQAGDLVLTDS